jgi:dihydrofolate reductase
MRKIIVVSFITMDGVLQAPGGPDEDRTNGFKWGGWSANFEDETTGNAIGQIFSKPFDLLLGRRTYEIFSAYWPYKQDEIGNLFNKINKYVVGTTPVDLSWKGSTQISKNVVSELKKLKEQDGADLLVHGSSRLVQTLLANQLVDELHTWIYPITIGKGKKLFEEGTQAKQWKLTNSEVSEKGVIIASYVPDGELKPGSMIGEDEKPSDAEMERRKKWEKEDAKKIAG